MTDFSRMLQRIDSLLHTYCVGSLSHSVLGSEQPEQPSQNVAVPSEVNAIEFLKLSLEKQKAISSVLDVVRSLLDGLRITVSIERLCVYAQFITHAQLIVLVHVVQDHATSYTCYLRPTVTNRIYTTHVNTIEDVRQVGIRIAQFSKFMWNRGLNENVSMGEAVPYKNTADFNDSEFKQILIYFASITPDPTTNIKVDEPRGYVYASFTENVELVVITLKRPLPQHSKCYFRLDKSDAVYVVLISNFDEMKEIGQIINDISKFTWEEGLIADIRMPRILDDNGEFADEDVNDP